MIYVTLMFAAIIRYLEYCRNWVILLIVLVFSVKLLLNY
jgi:hypothetical protein